MAVLRAVGRKPPGKTGALRILAKNALSEALDMTQSVRNILLELKKELERIYGVRLRGVYLYGSYARG